MLNGVMRTTLNLDDDLVHIAKEMAIRRGTTIGRVISDMARQALKPSALPRMRNGVPLFVPKKGAAKPGMTLINRLRDGE
jgi:hypothetical protein